MLQYIVFAGVAMQLFGTFIYIRDIVKGRVKPNRITWCVWAVAPLIGTFAAVSDGVGWAVLPVFMSGFGPLLVVLFSFGNKGAYWKLGSFDYLCGTFSFLALLFWWITKDPTIAILFALLSDFFAALPTLIKSYKYPETENAGTYFLGVVSVVTCFFAAKVGNFSELAFPVYFIVLNTTLISLIWRKKILKFDISSLFHRGPVW